MDLIISIGDHRKMINWYANEPGQILIWKIPIYE
jgi:hypothetical protein